MFLADIGYGAVLCWCCYQLAREGREVRWILLGAFGMLSMFSLIHIGLAFSANDGAGFCDWAFSARSIYGSHYTAWSTSLALVLPVVAIPAASAGRRVGIVTALTGALCMFSLAGSLFIAGGRAGVLGALISLAALALFRHPAIRTAACVVAAAVVGLLVFDGSCPDHLRLNRLTGGYSRTGARRLRPSPSAPGASQDTRRQSGISLNAHSWGTDSGR